MGRNVQDFQKTIAEHGHDAIWVEGHTPRGYGATCQMCGAFSPVGK